MPIYETGKLGLTWEQKIEKDTGASGTLGVTLPSTAVTAQLDARLAFRQSVNNYWEFETLDCMIIQPTAPYIEDSLESDLIQKEIARQTKFFNAWTLYMVSGLVIARGSRAQLDENKKAAVRGNIGW